MGNFGSGKTYWTFLELFKLNKDKNYIIANVPYSIVDHYRSTQEDLLQVFEILGRYSEESNRNVKDLFKTRKQQKNIILVVDEAHLYLWARESLTKASIPNQLKTIFTQCRKRKIRSILITQRLTQIDIYVRRLSDYVEEYHYTNLIVFERVRKRVYLNKGDVADIETDNSIKITNDGEAQTIKQDTQLSSSIFRPLTTGLQILSYLDKDHQRMIKEEYKTLHICGYEDIAVKPLTYEAFCEWIKVPKKNQGEEKKWLIKKFKLWYQKVLVWYNKRELNLDLEYYDDELRRDLKLREVEEDLERKENKRLDYFRKLELEENGSNTWEPTREARSELSESSWQDNSYRGHRANWELSNRRKDHYKGLNFYQPTSMNRGL